MRADPEDRFDLPDGLDGARSRRGILSILVAGVAVIAFGAAVWFAYTLGARSGSPSDIPLVTARQGPWKKRPEDPGGLEVPNQDKAVFNRLEPEPVEPKKEQLLPPPEEPLKRPPPMPPRAPSGADITRPLPTGADLASGSPETTPPPEKPAAKTSASDAGRLPQEVRSEAAPREATRDVASLPPQSAKPSTGSGYRIQLAALRSEADARREWRRIQSANQDLLGKLSIRVERADLGGGRGVFYRLQAGPLEDKALAELLCGKLEARDLACLVVAR